MQKEIISKLKMKLLMKRVAVAAVILPGLVMSSFGAFGIATATAETGQTCSTITLVSGAATTVTAGFTETNPLAAPLSLTPGSYSGGSFSGATLTQTVIPPWVDPSTDPDLTGSGAAWVSSDATWPGGAGNTEGSSTADQWRLFRDTFTLPAGATVTSANLWYTTDNAGAVYLNENATAISTTNGTSSEDVYGVTPEGNVANYAQVFTASFNPVVGANTLDFVVRNWSDDATSNPTGLVYRAVIEYCVPEAPTSVTVTINKFVDGSPATATSTGSAEFPMSATWNATNIGAGTGTYGLGASNETPYEAMTVAMDSGADYTTNEVFTGDVVGAQCADGKPFALVGYTTGDTYAEAASAMPTSTVPAFVGLESDKYVIVWNDDCATGQIGGDVEGSNGVLAVTSIESVDTSAIANGSFEDGWKYIFHITVPMNEQNFAMKFADWQRTGGGGTIPAANNMRISSMQADNGGATVLITAANVYSTPPLHMTGDLNLAMDGLQIEVTVEVAVPNGTPTGSYSTSYGVQTTP